MKITLCGSTRFREEFHLANKRLTLAGHLVYSVGWFIHDVGGPQPTDREKLLLDAVHMRKIMESDAIYVLNKGGYIGESTLREMYMAQVAGKMIFTLEGWETADRKYQELPEQYWGVVERNVRWGQTPPSNFTPASYYIGEKF